MHYAVDSSGWEWNVYKKALTYERDYGVASKNADAKWKRDTFPKGLGKSLNEIALVYEETEEDKYFWFQSKILNGYTLSDRDSPDPHGWTKRKEGLRKVKQWFKYDKEVCKGEKELEFSNEGRAPWMDIAIKIAKEMKGCTEERNPMYSNAKKYLRYCGNTYEPTDGENGPWCAAFMNWTIGQTINPIKNQPYSHAKSAASLAPLWTNMYKKISEPVYGCLVVYKHSNGKKGHTGFLVGKTKDGKYILLGGNQDNTIRFDSYGEYTSKSKTKKLYGFYLPKDYEIKESDYLTNDDIYENSNSLNIKFGIIAGKSKGQTN